MILGELLTGGIACNLLAAMSHICILLTVLFQRVGTQTPLFLDPDNSRGILDLRVLSEVQIDIAVLSSSHAIRLG